MKIKILSLAIYSLVCVSSWAQQAPSIKDENYYRSKGYQVFSEFKLAVKCPTTLKDVSRQSNANFEMHYAGVLNENSKAKIVFYQAMMIRLPAGHKDMTKGDIEKMFRELYSAQGNGKFVLWGYENYPAYVAEYMHNGYLGKGISVLVDNKVFAFNVITNDDLSSKFNNFTNNVIFFDTQNSPNQSPQSKTSVSNNNPSMLLNGTTYTSRQRRFLVDYPKGWEAKEDRMQNIQYVLFLAPEKGADFRTNFNVIVSNRTETAEVLSQMAQRQNISAFAGYKLNGKEYVSIGGTRGIKHIASYELYGHPVKGIQYILKKTDNTVYTITFTVGEQFYARDKNLVENIIQTFQTL